MILALRLARRELRGGLRGFRVFLACLALGVAAIATVQSLSAGILASLEEDGRAILGGDVSVRLIYRPAEPEERASLEQAGTVSLAAKMRAIARVPEGEANALVELKAVDAAYPLYGALRLQGGGDPRAALAQGQDGVWGAVVDPAVLNRLDLAPGDAIEVGEAVFAIRGVIEREPDRATDGLTLGPRVMIAEAALPATGLVLPGSMVFYHYGVRLADGGDVDAFTEDLAERFPQAGWQVRDYRRAAPQVERMIERLTTFMTLVGLTALLVGGVGVGNAVKAYLDGKISTIATLKCLGAPGRLVFSTYLGQILMLAAAGIVVGLVVGAGAPVLLGRLISGVLPVEARIGLYPGALLLAAAFGLLTALAFSLWPLARAQGLPAGALFRDVVAGIGGRPPAVYVAATALTALALAALAVLSTDNRRFALWFVAGAAAVILAFRLAAWAVMAATRALGRPRRPGLRLALANVSRPGAPTPSVVLSLGLGLTVLVAIALIEGNMSRQVQETLPRDAPAFFFVDIQPDQREPFEALVAETAPGAVLEMVPSLRGQIVAVNGVPAAEALVDSEEGWVIRGDRGVTYAAEQGPSHQVVAGQWWPADYAGPPLVSVYEDVAAAFAIGLGDRITVNVLGRDIEAEIASIRDIEWEGLGLNYILVYSPQPLASAPHTFVATVRADPAAEAALERAVLDRFANVTPVAVRDALDQVNDILLRIGMAVRSTAGVTLVAGTLVLAGAIAAGHRRRVYDAVVLKVLGATRATVLRAFLLEYGLLGSLTAVIAALFGTIAAWAVLTWVMEIDWIFLPWPVLVTAVASTVVTVAFGFVGTGWALGQKAAPLLRNE